MSSISEDLAAMHYWHRMTTLCRFWSSIQRNYETGCWEWIGQKRDRRGYGSICIRGRNQRAHRVSYSIHFGSIPDGAYICHRCDNPSCVNPEHLYAGTQLDNMRDRKLRGRDPDVRGIKNGRAKLTEQQVRDIRASGESDIKLGARYGVRPGMIWYIRTGRCWKHV